MPETLDPRQTEAVAKACLKTARQVSNDMLRAVERQQKRQQKNLRDTTKLIEKLLAAKSG